MIERIVAAFSYLGILPWVIVYALFKDDEFVNSHLRQSLIVSLLNLLFNLFALAKIPLLAYICFVLWVILALIGIGYAILGEEEAPILSDIYNNYLDQYLGEFF